MAFYNQNSSYYSSSYYQAPPLQLCFFLLILVLFMGLSWYLRYESAFEGAMDQFKLTIMLLPLVLLLAVHWLSSDERKRFPFVIPLPERDSFHRAGSSAWGVGLILVFLLFMISYQSSLHERWFPLLSR
ncbi:uncharacterized protein LOC143876812 [Tasmannia lanceolata]|uniref:uncharacterized protein LOC143876812 n=1 Tax=Tasmannia lanceolata TaxID=3420 RepID=UPI0040630FCB